jgi:hypothetical protein
VAGGPTGLVPRPGGGGRRAVVRPPTVGQRRDAAKGSASGYCLPDGGREITFTSRIRAAGTPGVGSLVEVYHDPLDPTLACIAPGSLPNVVPALGLAEKWVIVNIWIMVGVVGMIISLVVLHAS